MYEENLNNSTINSYQNHGYVQSQQEVNNKQPMLGYTNRDQVPYTQHNHYGQDYKTGYISDNYGMGKMVNQPGFEQQYNLHGYNNSGMIYNVQQQNNGLYQYEGSNYQNNCYVNKGTGLNNGCSLFAAIVLCLTLINAQFITVVDYGDYVKNYSLSEFCGLYNYFDSKNMLYNIFALMVSSMFFLVLLTTISLFISSFTNFKMARNILALITFVIYAIFTCVFLYSDGLGDEIHFGLSYYLIWVGIVLGIISGFTDKR